MLKKGAWKNPISLLQEILQGRGGALPTYEFSPDGNTRTNCQVMHNGREVGRGRGPNQQQAKENAAQDALRKMKKSSEAGS